MKREQVDYLKNHCNLPDSCNHAEIAETHISWVILTDNYAFKIKRPVTFSFLNFSTIEKRKYYCHRELKLNQRLEPDMYLKVVPVTKNMVGKQNGKDDDDNVIDYAVQMKRMDHSKEMETMLKQNQVNESHIEKLAARIVEFHQKAQVIKNAFNTLKFHEKYADIHSVEDFVKEEMGDEWYNKIKSCTEKSFRYLNAIRNLSNQRVITGFHKDCHGDLNARNIFLYDEPVIFDCIEFNSEYRKIDVLNDIAFLCVDLDFYQKKELGEFFYKKYHEFYGLEDDPKIKKLFMYYKSYRANVRTKVTLINAQKAEGKQLENELRTAARYIDLMTAYLEDFD